MPDLGANGPLIAALLQGQRQDTSNPFAQQRKYGQELIIKGGSTAPLGSGNALEGIARALQGGLGGLMTGYADQKEQEQNQADIGIMSEAAKIASTNPTGAADMLKGLKGNSYESRAMLGQLLQGAFTTGIAQQQAKGVYDRSGAGTTPAAAPSTGSGLVIDINKPTPAYQTGGTPSGFDNNLMNIRASNAPFADKGAPQNGFETFATPQAGANATVDNFKAYVQQNPTITVAQAIAKWAPPNENNTNGYISRVSETSGINPATPLAQVMQNPVDMARLMEAAIPVEKGKIPAGVTPDVLVNAGNRAAPQMAQAQGPQPSPPQIGQVPPSPEAAQFRAQEQQFARQGDYVQANAYRQKALEAEAKWASTLQQKQAEIGMQGAEADRQQAGKTMNNEQSLSATFADRMSQSNAIIDKVGPALGDFKSRSLDSKVLGVGVPGANYMVSDEYRQARQARDNFINSQLRRESGAAIAPSEYENADRQYFPQPGDDPTTLANKARNRQAAVEGMVRGAGPTYQMPQGGAAPAAKAGGNELLDQAREAIRQGKDKAKVIEVLKANGGDPGQL